MSIVIYTYHDPYKIDQEPYWDEIKNCPYFCSAQTLVNGLRSHYKEKFDGGRVSTVKILTDSLYVDWASTAWIVKQHTDIDNIINSGFSTDLSESEQINIGRAFLFNRDDVFTSIRTMFELNVDPSAILKNKLTKEQRFILGIYQKILASEMKKDFYLARSLAEEEIDEGLRRAMTAKQEDYDFSDVNLDTIVIHGVHQFNPIMLRAIDELQKYKNVILLFNYQKQYKNVYQTWFDIYSAFDCKIIDCDRNEFLATDSSTVSYKGNVLADQLGKLVNGQRRAITVREYAEKTGKKHIITTSIEHKAILETVKALEKKGYDIEIVDPERSGFVKSEDILSRVREDTLLVSVMHVNNETGIIQPVEHIGKVLSERRVLFHVDATQSCGKLIKEIRGLNYNMLSFSAHKLQGPQGIGVLVLRKDGYRLPPIKGIMYGGQQEHGIRPGTIPVALVAGCGYACEIASLDYERNKEKMDALKKLVLTIFDESGINYHFNGDQRHCVNSAVNICIPGVASEALMIMTKQYCSISNGSACTSKSYSPSYVLKAMGIPEEEIECSVRISWGPDTSSKELKENLVKMIEIAKQIKG